MLCTSGAQWPSTSCASRGLSTMRESAIERVLVQKLRRNEKVFDMLKSARNSIGSLLLSLMGNVYLA
jgi:hypothetical protein